jgi:hypothetical protein
MQKCFFFYGRSVCFSLACIVHDGTELLIIPAWVETCLDKVLHLNLVFTGMAAVGWHGHE